MKLEEIARSGRINLAFESWRSLLHDYRTFKNNESISPVILKEMRIRTEKSRAVFKRSHNKITMVILFADKYYIVRPDIENHIQVKEYYNAEEIKGFDGEDAAIIKIYQIAGKIRNIIKKRKELREKVKATPEEKDELWSEYKTLGKELERLDPFNPDLQIGILGKSFFAGLADQG